MTIINAKEGADWPGWVLASGRVLRLTRRGFRNVQDNGNTVLVIVSNQTLMSVCRITSDNPVAPHRCLTILICQMWRQENLACRLESVISVLSQWAILMLECLTVRFHAIVVASCMARTDTWLTSALLMCWRWSITALTRLTILLVIAILCNFAQ